MQGYRNFIFFIAQKLQRHKNVTEDSVNGSKRAAKPITRIAILSIALAMIVNTITMAVVQGFQQEVSRKVIGFGSHISIQKDGETSLKESVPLMRNAEFERQVVGVKGVTGLYSVAYKPALLQSRSKNDQKEILGVVLKGVDKNYNWDNFKAYVKEGALPKFELPNSNEILISRSIANDLHYEVGDTLNAFFVKQKPIQRQFRITGIYETGLEEFDKELVYCYLPQVQQLNDWGISAEIGIDDTLEHGEFIVRANVSGGNGNYRYDWGKGYENYAGFTICPTKDTTIRLIVSDYWNFIDEPAGDVAARNGETSIPDTCYLEIKVTGDKQGSCIIQLDSEGNIVRKYTDESGYSFAVNGGKKSIHFSSFPGVGSYSNYVGSYEITVSNLDQLDEIKKRIRKAVMFNPNLKEQVRVSTIKELQQDIFVWLGFLDINLYIVLILMLIIGIVNMGSALLVIILVRSNFIGVLKALGATSGQIRKIFLVHVGSLIGKGMFWGNLLGVGLCLIQKYFNVLRLDPKVYYLNTVPIELDVFKWIVLNVLTLAICLLAMILPSLIISKVSPAKTIRFK